MNANTIYNEIKEPLNLEPIAAGVDHIDRTRIIDGYAANQGAILNMPSKTELKTFITDENARQKANGIPRTVPLWDFGDGLPAVNAKYLLEMLSIFPDATVTASKMHPLTNALYFKSDHADGALLPIRKN